MNGLRTTPDELLLAAQDGGDGMMYTGRQIITFKEGATEAGLSVLHSAETRVAHSGDSDEEALAFDDAGDAEIMMFDELGIAVASAEAPVMEMTAAREAGTMESPIEAIEPEIFMFALGNHYESFLSGFAAAAERIRDELVGSPDEFADEEDAAAQAQATWGLVATLAAQSRWDGGDIKVAILDTGFDFQHPDFALRLFDQASFVAGQSSQDVHGHGTHCTGTACGPLAPLGVERYGIAHASMIHIGKVLSNSGTGTSASILAGMNWAVGKRCEVISMSLGGGGGPYSYYTAAGRRALAANCLIIAAAGNASARPRRIAPTMAPANSPTIMAVAALDERLRVAGFSCGGKIDIAGPGVNVFSSLPMPRQYASWNGTSMAAPHVAGVAALWAHSDPLLRASLLRDKLVRSARRLRLPRPDVGAGLVQAP